MDIATILSLGQTALELGLICSLTVLALYLSYSMLNVCDLSTDGCFTLGAAVGAIVVISGHPYLAIPAAMAAGICSGFVTAILQTKLGVDSLLSGIIVNTGLYSINIAIMGGSSLLNMNKVDTVFSLMKDLLKGTVFAKQYKLAVALIAVIVILVLLTLFLKTRLGLAIRATGNNPDMVRSSSINTAFTTIIGLCIAGSFTALSGCLLAQSQKAVDINIGTGMVTIAPPRCSSAALSWVRAAYSLAQSALCSALFCSDWSTPSRCASICRHSCSSSYPLSSSCLPSPSPISKADADDKAAHGDKNAERRCVTC